MVLVFAMFASAQSVVARAKSPSLAPPVVDETRSAHIAKISRPPNFEAMLAMDGAEPESLCMTKIEKFTQTDPDDGKQATQRTIAYLGYDTKHNYVAYLAFDTDLKSL